MPCSIAYPKPKHIVWRGQLNYVNKMVGKYIFSKEIGEEW